MIRTGLGTQTKEREVRQWPRTGKVEIPGERVDPRSGPKEETAGGPNDSRHRDHRRTRLWGRRWSPVARVLRSGFRVAPVHFTKPLSSRAGPLLDEGVLLVSSYTKPVDQKSSSAEALTFNGLPRGRIERRTVGSRPVPVSVRDGCVGRVTTGSKRRRFLFPSKQLESRTSGWGRHRSDPSSLRRVHPRSGSIDL